jgi:hypothetical protein
MRVLGPTVAGAIYQFFGAISQDFRRRVDHLAREDKVNAPMPNADIKSAYAHQTNGHCCVRHFFRIREESHKFAGRTR